MIYQFDLIKYKTVIKSLCFVVLITAPLLLHAQYSISGTVTASDEPVQYAIIKLVPLNEQKLTNENGFFRVNKLLPATYEITVTVTGYKPKQEKVMLTNKDLIIDFRFTDRDLNVKELETVTVSSNRNEMVSGRLKDVAGTSIYAGKKTELINIKNLNANLASNNTRQIYARIPGLNIWEYDRGGLQLGIGGRGLSPNRSSNFNIRQNGYDISADALGYPESYYTPSTEAVDRIEIVRGAASLQYGPQFGGLVNFVMKEGPKEKPVELTLRQTVGSYGFFNSFNSVGGTIAKGRLNYYGFYQYKVGDDWRPNSHYNQHNGYAHLAYNVADKFRITGEYTLMKYLAQQPGGLTDAQFKEDPSVSVRARNWFEVNWNLISLSFDLQFNEHTRFNWRNYTLQGARDALGNLSYINRPDDGGNRDFMSDAYSNFGSEIRFIHQYKLLKETLSTLLIGTRFYKGLTDRRQGDGNNGDGPDFEFTGEEPDKSSYQFPGTNIAAFAENVFQINPRWTVTPGFRFEYINTKAEGYYYKKNIFVANDKIFENKSNPRSFVLLGIGTAWKITGNKEVYANISQNYRSINFNDIRVINQNAKVDSTLKDETGYNIDLGFRGTFGNWLYVDVSGFYLRYNDRIGSIFTRDMDFMTYRLRTNVSDSRNIGTELLLDGDILKAISRGTANYKLNLYTALSLIDARYINTKNTAISDKLVENVPPVTFRTGASFGNNRFNISFQYAYQAKQYSDATNTEETPTAVDGAIPAFHVMDLSVRYNWRTFTIFGGVNNLTNEKYFTRRADGYPGPGILPSDKRNLYITLQFKL